MGRRWVGGRFSHQQHTIALSVQIKCKISSSYSNWQRNSSAVKFNVLLLFYTWLWLYWLLCTLIPRFLKTLLLLFFHREAAKECRRRKKEYVKCLETRVAVLENQNKQLIDELKTLKELYVHKQVD